MIAFREAKPADVVELRRRCFPEDDLERPRPARMFVAEDEGRPVAALGFIPQTYVIGGNEYAGALAVDAMTDPAYRKQGLFRRVAQFARDAIREQYALSTAWQIRPAVLGGMTAAGWAPVLRAPVLVKPLLWRRRGRERSAPAREALLANYAHVRLDSAEERLVSRHLPRLPQEQRRTRCGEAPEMVAARPSVAQAPAPQRPSRPR